MKTDFPGRCVTESIRTLFATATITKIMMKISRENKLFRGNMLGHVFKFITESDTCKISCKSTLLYTCAI